MSYKISLRIEMVCKSLNIPYHSPYLAKTNFHADALQLRELYLQLKQIVGSIIEIADKHGNEDLTKILWNDIKLLEHADHDLIKIANSLNKENNCGN